MHARSFWRQPFVTLFVASLALAASVAHAQAPTKPLKALLVIGGCCHDYAKQKDILKEGIEARAHVAVTVVYSPDTTTRARFEIYEKSDWAAGYDVVIHDECSSDVKDTAYVENILAAHRGGVPAVNLHCAMHSYRIASDEWFQFTGIQSSRHDKQAPIEISFIDRSHPVCKSLENWSTVNEELYNNLKVFDTARILARGKQDTGKSLDDYAVVWTNQYGKGRVFSTTLGHNNQTVADPRYLDLVTRGLLWSCDKLNEMYLKPAPKEAAKSNKPGPQPTLADPPKGKASDK